MTTDLTKFIPHILPEVFQCPSVTITDAVKQAAIEFCTKSHLWVNTSEATTITEDENVYKFTPPTGAKVITVSVAFISGERVYSKTVEWLDRCVPGWRTLTEAVPRYYFMKEEGNIQLVGTPSVTTDDALTLDAILKPSQDATSVPEFLFEDWVEILSAGALARLQSIPGRVWTDSVRAAQKQKQFRRGINAAKARRWSGGTEGGLSINPLRFGGV